MKVTMPLESKLQSIEALSAETELKQAKALISTFFMREFDHEPNFSDLSRIGLAGGMTSDYEHKIEIIVNLNSSKLLYTVDTGVVRELQFGNLTELNEYLANLSFNKLVADAEKAYFESARCVQNIQTTVRKQLEKGQPLPSAQGAHL